MTHHQRFLLDVEEQKYQPDGQTINTHAIWCIKQSYLNSLTCSMEQLKEAIKFHQTEKVTKVLNLEIKYIQTQYNLIEKEV